MTRTNINLGVAARSGGARLVNSPRIAARVPARPALFDSILVPVDFSAQSIESFREAVRLAEQFDGSVHLLHVVDKKKHAAFQRLALLPDDAGLIAMAEEKLVNLAQTAGHPLVPVFPVVRLGEPWREIADAAKRRRATVVILPTRGLSGVKHALLGSVAERVVRHAPCPVLIFRSATETSAQTRRRL
jgi:universal stress protein A